jgi:hypothetical protein
MKVDTLVVYWFAFVFIGLTVATNLRLDLNRKIVRPYLKLNGVKPRSGFFGPYAAVQDCRTCCKILEEHGEVEKLRTIKVRLRYIGILEGLCTFIAVPLILVGGGSTIS